MSCLVLLPNLWRGMLQMHIQGKGLKSITCPMQQRHSRLPSSPRYASQPSEHDSVKDASPWSGYRGQSSLRLLQLILKRQLRSM